MFSFGTLLLENINYIHFKQEQYTIFQFQLHKHEDFMLVFAINNSFLKDFELIKHFLRFHLEP